MRPTTTALVLVTLAATLFPSLVSAQASTTSRRERVARSLASSTVAIESSVAEGAGFVVGRERWIVTNFYVVEGAAPGSIRVHFASGTTRSARVLSSWSECDLAVLAIDGGPAPALPLPLADSDRVRVGQLVYAVGSPFSTVGSVQGARVTARQSILRSALPLGRELIETDATLPSGSAGAPLVDADGRVIGVNWVRRRDGGTQYVAIPSNHVRALLERVRDAQSHAPPSTAPASSTLAWIGIVGEDSVAGTLAGVRVLHVTTDSAAARAGILGGLDTPSVDVEAGTTATVGDTIMAIDSQPIGNLTELEAFLSSCAPGQTVRLLVREGLGPTRERTMVLPALR